MGEGGWRGGDDEEMRGWVVFRSGIHVVNGRLEVVQGTGAFSRNEVFIVFLFGAVANGRRH